MVKINPNSLEALKKINEAGAIRVTDKVELFKELVKAGNTPNEAKKIVIQRFNLQRGKATGTPKWMTRGKIVQEVQRLQEKTYKKKLKKKENKL
jgi:hypothetical protein